MKNFDERKARYIEHLNGSGISAGCHGRERLEAMKSTIAMSGTLLRSFAEALHAAPEDGERRFFLEQMMDLRGHIASLSSNIDEELVLCALQRIPGMKRALAEFISEDAISKAG